MPESAPGYQPPSSTGQRDDRFRGGNKRIKGHPIAAAAEIESVYAPPARYRLPPDLPPNAVGSVVTGGMVAEFSTVERKPKQQISTATANCQAMFSTVGDTYERQGFDYFETGARKGLKGVPKSFGGVSGGGLWQVDLSKDKDGEFFWNGILYFRGVAFWETAPNDGLQIIRHHGPKSIFETAWKEWGFPEDA